MQSTELMFSSRGCLARIEGRDEVRATYSTTHWPPDDPDLDGAIDAMTAEELRSFVRGALEGLDDEPHAALVDSLIARAAKGRSGWRPSGPSRRIVDEVEHFAEAKKHSRFHAFQQELKHALASVL